MEQTQTQKIDNSAKLSNAYNVWVMCKNYVADPVEGKANLEKLYQSENKEVAKFDSVGDFWKTYTHLRRPSAMQAGVNLHYVSQFLILLIFQ
jgi:translation initiation factor 4E